MRGYPSTHSEISEFRVEKAKAHAAITLSSGLTVTGAFFVSGRSATHNGPERVKDVLNSETGFVPFEVTDSSSRHTTLFNRDHILCVELIGNAEARLDPGYDVATRRKVSMLLSNGARLSGHVSVYRPRGLDRLSDFARSPERFQYLETVSATLLINVQHLVELTEETQNS